MPSTLTQLPSFFSNDAKEVGMDDGMVNIQLQIPKEAADAMARRERGAEGWLGFALGLFTGAVIALLLHL